MIFILAFWLLIIAVVLSKTRFGRHTYAIGGNKEAALMSGVNVKSNSMWGFVFCGIGNGDYSVGFDFAYGLRS